MKVGGGRKGERKTETEGKRRREDMRKFPYFLNFQHELKKH